MLPPWSPGGMLLWRPGWEGATPMVPRCGRSTVVTSATTSSRGTDPGTTMVPGRSASGVVFQSSAGTQRAARSGLPVDGPDRHPFLAEVPVQMAPVGSQVGAVVDTRSGKEVEDADLQHIAGSGARNGDGSGEHVGAGAPVDDLLENAGNACVHQQVGGVTGVVGQRLDRHQVTGIDGEHRFEGVIRNTPQCTAPGVARSVWSTGMPTRPRRPWHDRLRPWHRLRRRRPATRTGRDDRRSHPPNAPDATGPRVPPAPRPPR